MEFFHFLIFLLIKSSEQQDNKINTNDFTSMKDFYQYILNSKTIYIYEKNSLYHNFPQNLIHNQDFLIPIKMRIELLLILNLIIFIYIIFTVAISLLRKSFLLEYELYSFKNRKEALVCCCILNLLIILI